MREKRLNILKVRYSDDEFARLKSFVQMPLAKYIRQVSLDNVVVRRLSPPKVDAALLRQLVGMGNNLNQLTKLAHQQYNYSNLDMVLMSTELALIRQQLDMLFEHYAITNLPEKSVEESLDEIFGDEG